MITAWTEAHVVNAGDGTHQHPTQCLLDLYTMRAALGGASRASTSRSSATSCTPASPAPTSSGLRTMGAHVTLVGPPTLIPRDAAALGVDVSHSMSALADADVVYVLRMQRERMARGVSYVPEPDASTRPSGESRRRGCAPASS